ncbi:hypothetical protein CW304_13475 [Bacillus sp. UFRGS-B20]|nr:hypothetical protein CW304_13475 [Bacillus sp. UFRGS-B20]
MLDIFYFPMDLPAFSKNLRLFLVRYMVTFGLLQNAIHHFSYRDFHIHSMNSRSVTCKVF